MAEFAEKYIQSTVAEVEEMERIGLLEKREIRALIQKRREFEYRLSKRYKDKNEFFDCINYEKKFLELLVIRRKKNRIFEKMDEIERAIKLRVMKRCRYVSRLWPHHHDVWALRIDFAKTIGWKAEASIAYAEQVGYLGHLESLYISWAKFEIEERENFDMARKVLLTKASLYHSKSLLIKRELFRLELLYVEYLKKKIKEDKAIMEVKAENREKILQCEIPRVVYQNSVKDIPDPLLYLYMYDIANKFSFAHDIREEIYRDLVVAFPNSESLWKLKAQRIVMGIETVGTGEEESKPLLAIDKLKATITVYDEALVAVGSSFFASYIEELLLMLHECWANNQVKTTILEKIVSLFESNKSLLLSEHYLVWFQILCKQPGSSNLITKLLEDALEAYPDAAPLRLESFKRSLASETSDEEKIAKMKEVLPSVKGTFGIGMWELALQSIKNRKLKMEQYLNGCNHIDDTVAKEMRISYLKWTSSNRPIKYSRALYNEYSMRPPFSAKLHAAMVMTELTSEKKCIKTLPPLFENAIMFFGKSHPGLWITYINFLKSSGKTLNAAPLYTRAETQLDTKRAEVFRQLNAMTEGLAKKKPSSTKKKTDADDGEKDDVCDTGEVWVIKKDFQEEAVHQKSPAVRLFDEEPMLTYSVDQERKAFFSKLKDMKKLLETGYNEIAEDDGSEWEDVLEKLLGKRVPLTIHQVTMKKDKQIEVEASDINENKHRKKKYELSDHLDPGTKELSTTSGKSEIDKILQSSFTLQPEFMQQTELSPYDMSKAKAKKLRKKERAKTKGAGWYDMKQPEMTEELKRDIKILQMRQIFDPKRPFKNKDLQVVPKYFQMGKIVDSAADFYSSRVPKKERKRTMAEEILHDEEALQYQKRKYNEIIAKKQKVHANFRSEGGRKVKKRKT